MKHLLGLFLVSTMIGCASIGSDINGPSKFIAVKENDQITQLFYQAKQAVEREALDEAMTIYESMRAQGVESPDTLNDYAVLLRQHWYLAEAKQVYSDALKMADDYPNTHWNMAIYYELYGGDYNRALEHYRKYQQLAVKPDQRVAGWIIDLERRITAQQQN